MKKLLHLLAVALIAMSVASCGGGGAKVKEAIIVEDCIKIPKQNVPIRVYQDDSEWDLEAIVKMENIKAVDESEIAKWPMILIKLLDKDGTELIQLGASIQKSLITKAGTKAAVEFGTTGGDPTQARLEEIVKQAKTVVFEASNFSEEIF